MVLARACILCDAALCLFTPVAQSSDNDRVYIDARRDIFLLECTLGIGICMRLDDDIPRYSRWETRPHHYDLFELGQHL